MATSRSRAQKRRSEASEEGGDLEVTETGQRSDPASLGQDLHIPLTSRAVFWLPRHQQMSESLLHVPFLFWLIETCRPGNVVQIGTGDGVAFMAVCQAVDKLSLGVPCLGLNLEGDLPAMPGPMTEQHRSHYEDFSFVISEGLAASVRHVCDQDIDLLILSAELTDDRVMALRAHWQSRLSDRAVMLLMDPDRTARGASAREFIESYEHSCPSVRIAHSDSEIVAYLVGKEQPERLKALASLSIGDPGYLAARQVFARLGQGIYQGQLARSAREEIETARGTASVAEDRLARREDELKALHGQLERAVQAETEQAALANDLNAKLFDAEAARAARDAQAAELERAQAAEADLTAKLEASEKDAAALRDRVKMEAAQQAEKLASAEKMLVAERARTAELEARVSELEERLAEEKALAAKAGEEADALRTELEEAASRHGTERDRLVRDYDGRLGRIRRELETRGAELKTEHEERLRDVLALSKEVELRAADVAERNAKIGRLKQRLAAAEDRRDALLSSTSWRVTAPMRSFRRMMKT